MDQLSKYKDELENLSLFIKERKLDISSPEKLQIVMNDWLRNNIKFYNKFDDLTLEHKKRLLNLK